MKRKSLKYGIADARRDETERETKRIKATITILRCLLPLTHDQRIFVMGEVVQRFQRGDLEGGTR